ncbi:hypothetical protein BH10PSE3_BH10PSE3_42430 [soil metagenome]
MRGLIRAIPALLATPVPARAQLRAVAPEGALNGGAGEGAPSLFLGVPFTRPSVENLRWRPLRPVAWTAHGAWGRYLAFTSDEPVARQGLASAACEHIQIP